MTSRWVTLAGLVGLTMLASCTDPYDPGRRAVGTPPPAYSRPTPPPYPPPPGPPPGYGY
jgi:hypothetical protein